MAEFLCRGYKCACGQVVQLAQLDKSKPFPKIPPNQHYVGGFAQCPTCGKDTFVKPDAWVEWTKVEAVQ